MLGVRYQKVSKIEISTLKFQNRSVIKLWVSSCVIAIGRAKASLHLESEQGQRKEGLADLLQVVSLSTLP